MMWLRYWLLVLAFTTLTPLHAQPSIDSNDEIQLRAGDVLWLAMPGESAFNVEASVNRAGMISVPEVGEVTVGGLTLIQATEQIKQRLSTLFVDLSGFDVTLKKRRLMIQVLGYVKKPGSVDLPMQASIQEALNQAGGLLPGAQLDRIQVRRGSSVETFDYKHYLDNGDDSLLPQLKTLDTLFIPASNLLGNVQMSFDAALKSSQSNGKKNATITVIGEVKNPGNFEWHDELTLFELLMRAGGADKSADLGKINILSSDENGRISSRYFDMADFMDKGGLLSQVPTLSAGNTVIVPSMSIAGHDDKSQWLKQSADDSIYVMGEVVSPGRYRFNNRMHLLDLLSAAKGPNDKADIHNIRITHRNGTNTHVSRLDLGRYFELGDESLLPKVSTGDVIYIPAKQRLWLNYSAGETIRVLGAVNKQGRYRFAAPMTLLDLLAQAGGLAPTADSGNIVVVKGKPKNSQVTHFDLLGYADSGDSLQLPSLSTGDTVYVLHKQDSYWNRVVENIQDTLSVLSVLKILGAG